MFLIVAYSGIDIRHCHMQIQEWKRQGFVHLSKAKSPMPSIIREFRGKVIQGNRTEETRIVI